MHRSIDASGCNQCRTQRAVERTALPRHRCRGSRQQRPPGHADGHGRDRRGALAPASEAQSGRSDLARPRPLRAVQRPRLDAAVRAAAPDRLCAADRGTQALSPAAQQDPRPPRGRRHAGSGNHHRSARPGARQCGRHGAQRAAAGGGIQSPRAHHRRPSHLGVRRRRLPDGRHQSRSLLAGRNARAVEADRRLRRQWHQHRRPCRALVCR